MIHPYEQQIEKTTQQLSQQNNVKSMPSKKDKQKIFMMI